MLIDETITENEEINLCVKRKLNGEDFSTLRKELLSKGYPEEKVASMMREIEDRVVHSYQPRKMRVHPKMIAGLVLGIIGLTLFAIGINGILSFILVFSGIAMIAVRTPNKGGNIERSKWSRH